MSGTSEKMIGKAKQNAGKALGNEKLQAKGKMQEIKGQIKSQTQD